MTAPFGPYLLGGLLGRGGMGEVYRAHDRSQGGRAVAVKLLPSHLTYDEAYRARFRRECETAARLDSPHILPIHRYGEIDGRLFLDMQLVDGPDLAAVLLAEGALPAARAVALVEQVAAALDAAHGAGLVHRDVKPSNVLLARRGPPSPTPDTALLTDFGIAAGTGAGDGHGTVEYLAPERILGGPGDERSDTYALACVLVELLTGLRAFPGAEFAAQAHGHLHEPTPRPSALLPGVPAAFDDVVARGMAKDPAHRPASAGALAADARSALTARAGFGRAGFGRAGFGRAGFGRAGFGRAGFGRAGFGRAGFGRVGRRRLLVGAAALGGLAVAGAGTVAAVRALSPGPAPAVTERLLAVRSASDTPMAPVRIGRSPGVAVESIEGRLVFWDPIGDRAVGFGFRGLSPTGVALTELDGRAVAVAGFAGFDGTVTGRDLFHGRTVGAPFVVPGGPARGVTAALVDGRPVVAVLGGESVLYRYHLDDGSALGEPLPAGPDTTDGRLHAVAIGARPAVVRTTGFTTDAITELVDLAGGEVLGTGPPGAVFTELDGRAVAVGTDGSRIDVLALDGPPLHGYPAPGARTLAVAVLDGRPLVIADDLDATLTIRDLRTGQQVGGPLLGHTAAVTALGVTDLDGRPILVSAARDNTIRVWDLAVRAYS